MEFARRPPCHEIEIKGGRDERMNGCQSAFACAGIKSGILLVQDRFHRLWPLVIKEITGSPRPYASFLARKKYRFCENILAVCGPGREGICKNDLED